MIFAISGLIPPTSRGRLVKSCRISPGFAFSGHTPMKKFSSTVNLPDFDINETISSSMKPGSIVLSTITNECADKISVRFDATVRKAV